MNKAIKSIVRNSGGLAVVLDEGVLNISLIFPETEKGIDINRGYDTMWQLIQNMFAEYPSRLKQGKSSVLIAREAMTLVLMGKNLRAFRSAALKKGSLSRLSLCKWQRPGTG